MSSQFYPYSAFPGNGMEAMRYYHSVFGGELELVSYTTAAFADTIGDRDPETTVAHSTLRGGLDQPQRR